MGEEEDGAGEQEDQGRGNYTLVNVHFVQNSELTHHWLMVALKNRPRKNMVNLGPSLMRNP